MNEYFCSIGENLASKIEDAPNPLLAGDSAVNQKNTRFKFKHISTLDIRDAIAKLKTANSFGNDTISSYFLKLALPVMETSFAIMFNTSIETSQFPNLWKLARITPIFKGGDRSDKSNYRPISILPVISRLFEKLIADQLYQYMNENDMFSSNQSGFRRLHSTLTCLLKNTDDWYSGLDLGKLVGLVFIDLKKAFDTVNHDILCHKLSYYGIQQRELLWFQSYLSNREQFCRVNRIDSEINSINIGIPQGSCLGPLLFIIYINDLPQAVLDSNVSMYADDTSLCYQSLDINKLNEVINNDLEKLQKWVAVV